MHTLGTLTGARSSINNQNLVGRTTAVTIEKGHDKQHGHNDKNKRQIDSHILMFKV
jgi:hypothetical protein